MNDVEAHQNQHQCHYGHVEMKERVEIA